jgi:hypothetical protein
MSGKQQGLLRCTPAAHTCPSSLTHASVSAMLLLGAIHTAAAGGLVLLLVSLLL